MGQIPKRWGQGRVSFMADLASIRADLSRAIPLTEVFAARRGKLGITYSAFCKLVARYAADARVKPSGPAPTVHDDKIEGQPNRVRKTFDDHEGIADPALIRKLTSGR